MSDYIYSIFTWSQPQLAEKAVASFLPDEDYEIINTKERKSPSLAASWNEAIKRNLGKYEAVILMNDDVECVDPRPTGKALLGVLKKYGPYLNVIMTLGYDINLHGNKGLIAEPSFAALPGAFCMCVTQELIDKIGLFDEQFKQAWYEDTDMWQRIYLAGYQVAGVAPVNHFGGATTALDPEAATFKEKYIKANHQRYVKKWGGPPNREQYRTPYNK